MSPSRHAVFRCDASARIGGGHLRRCLTLAEALAANGWRISFALCRESLRFVPRDIALSPGWIVLSGSWEDEPADIAAAVGSAGADLLVVDHYGRERSFESRCRHFARRIAVIDDLADRPHDADLLLDQTLASTERDYSGLVPRRCVSLCGSRYALLRLAFAEKRQEALSRRRAGGPVRRILIGMGATDADDLTSAAIAAVTQVCERLARPLALDVVLGAGASHLDAVRRRLTGHPAWSIHVDASGGAMAGLMVSADLAIGAAGTTSWERCCLALPTVTAIAADNQAKISSELAAAGACRIMPSGQAMRSESIAEAVLDLCRDDGARLAMAEVAAAICDGAGTRRVVDAIEALIVSTASGTFPAE